MNSEANVSGDQLEDAFTLFNQMSARLADSYGDLETQVMHLSKELARVHDERLKELAEKELLAKRLEGLLNTLPAGIVVVDEQGCISQTNPIAEEMLGESLPGKVWDELTGHVFINQGDELRLQDGRWVSISARSLLAEPGKIILITDITETRNLQDVLNRQQRLTSLGEMVASLAHQVRTPLASALLDLSNITYPDVQQAARLRFAERAKGRLQHLERMINDMLVFARGGEIASECFEVNEFVAQFQQSFEPQLAASHATLVIDNRAPGAKLQGNRDALLGAFQNIANNAIEACDEAPMLEITVAPGADDNIEFEFIDNGCGIPEAIRERILEPFFTTRGSGTGLGLAVVNATVNHHNGKFTIESEEGKGSCIRISLPDPGKRNALPSGVNVNDIQVRPVYYNRYFSKDTKHVHMFNEVTV